MTTRLLLDEHYGEAIAVALRELGHDVRSVVADPDLRGEPDTEVFLRAADEGRRLVTENIKDFRPLLVEAHATGAPRAPLLLVSAARRPRGGGGRTTALIAALHEWLIHPGAKDRPDEDWLT